mgnify:CR=1 FL=1
MNWGLAIFGVAAVLLVCYCLQVMSGREVTWCYAEGVR